MTKPRKELWGGVIEFGDLEPGKYTATAEAWNAGENILEGSGSTEITVRAGETTDCNIAMILEGQTAYYSKYMILTDYSNIKKLYNYTTMQEIYIEGLTLGEAPYNPVEDREGKIYYIRDDTLHRNDEPLLSQIDASNLIKNPLYYDSTTDSLWLASFGSDKSSVNFSVFENPSAATSKPDPYKISYDGSYSNITSCQAFAVKEDNIYIAYNNLNILLTKKNNSSNTEPNITLSSITPALSGEVTDMAVLEDGTVAVLVNEKSLNPANQFTLNDGCTVYSRGALVLLSSDLSKVEKVLGWTASPRTISATGEDTKNPVKEWTSITAYIPDYAERNSHFYGPMRIVAIRPKELVIADCGANFVLADYKEHRQGKMFTHNRLMTVNLRNFAIGCKKEFREDELKFQNLSISGNIEVSTSGDWSNKYVDEK
ncbi:hypothetical protein [Treponema succinifaciens]|uniref:hypothetical protein n=1 Tax=Treponema succinifaciens TaxID=167 RepID=UPI0011D137DD|nr:hypothetical protein [Treponema succinifaciens]